MAWSKTRTCGHFPIGPTRPANFKYEELLATGGHLLGRVTYQAFAEAWPSRTDEQGFADRMNSLPKYVVSNTLQTAAWNNSTILSGDVPAEIAKLKAQPGGDLLVAGSMTLLQTLMAHNLVDEYRLLVYPLVRGQGQRLFSADAQAALQLTESRDMGSGVMLLRYVPAPAA